MKKSHIGIGVVITIIILTITSGAIWRQRKHSKYMQSTASALFFYGGGSSYHVEEHMVNAVKKAEVTSTVLRADVANNGKVTPHGSMHKEAINPIVEVSYDNNRQSDLNKHGEYAANVVKALQKHYRITEINMVGHSLGNISIIYYMLQNGKNQNMPQLQKRVDIAGHSTGLNFKQVPAAIRQPVGMKLNKDRKPNEMNAAYRQMTEIWQTYPKSQVAVLNIIDDVGNHSDGTVDNTSSLSLECSVAARAKSHCVLRVTGKGAQHSKLHNNAQVDKALIDFLWGK